MAIITCLKESKERRILQLDDIVEFTVKEQIIKYKVWQKFLNRLNKDNNEIFEILEIDKYKYKTNSGNWPDSKKNDFPALTRLVKELYLIIEEQHPIKVYTKFTRFEIMEI